VARTEADRAAGVALASLPAMGPGRLSAVVRRWGFVGAWRRVAAGDVLGDRAVAASMGKSPAQVRDQWVSAARGVDPAAALESHAAAAVDVTVYGSDRYPAALAADIDPPMVLFSRGDLDVMNGQRVALVGTRRATRAGRLTALEMGEALSGAGVRVVSGLALGIDGAAHEGAMRPGDGAPVIGVVGTGLDVVYPKRHQRLWEAVADRGVLLSEVPLGGGALPWRFPARNRIIAALAHLVVVIESHARGGALHTVDEALRRDCTVLVVPGSVRSPASAGTNALLHAGMGPARDAADVLTALGFTTPLPSPNHEPDRSPGSHPPTSLDPVDGAVLSALDDTPISLDQLAAATGFSLGELAVSLVRLEHTGSIVRTGSWIERGRR
jgi:DNA processing protein